MVRVIRVANVLIDENRNVHITLAIDSTHGRKKKFTDIRCKRWFKHGLSSKRKRVQRLFNS